LCILSLIFISYKNSTHSTTHSEPQEQKQELSAEPKKVPTFNANAEALTAITVNNSGQKTKNEALRKKPRTPAVYRRR